MDVLSEFVSAIPWPEFLYIGLPAFAAGFLTGRHGGARHTKETTR